MSIKTILKQLPDTVRELPATQMLIEVIDSQALIIHQLHEQVQKQAEQVQSQQKTIDELKDEISRLNKTPKRPKFRSANLEPRNKGSQQHKKTRGTDGQVARAKSKTREEQRLKPASIPEGSRFKGYQEFSVQEVKIIAKEILYKLEVWQTPGGQYIKAELPKELRGKHFGPQLRALIINLYAQGLTQPAIFDFLSAIDIEISTGQVNNILLEEAEGFSKVSEAILSAGLKEAPYVQTDDTGEKHQHKSGYCTHIGGEHFAFYKTSSGKSRENFLNILLQGKEGYHINEAMIWHLFQSSVPDHILNLFEEHQGKRYRSKKDFQCFLDSLQISGKKLTKQCYEAGLVGYISKTLLKEGQVLLSDRAGQFAVFNHAACWVHMERPLRKIPATNDLIEEELKRVRGAIWHVYRLLKESAFTGKGKEEVIKEYKALISLKSTSAKINEVIASFRDYEEELLKGLDYPVPLHNNGSEQVLRERVKRRNISGSTKSELGKQFRDGLTSIKQTCKKLGVSFWEFTVQWFYGEAPDLSAMIQERYALHSSGTSGALEKEISVMPGQQLFEKLNRHDTDLFFQCA
jgi:hypothetical protein